MLSRLGRITINKNMTKFKTEYFDEGKYKKDLQELETAEARFMDALEKLNSEGIPTDYGFIVKLSKFSDEDFLNYIKEAFRKYIDNLGLVVKEERKRIAAIYDTIYSNTLPAVQTIRKAFSKGLIISKGEDGTFIVNTDKMKDEAKKRNTIEIDTDLMSEYYDLLMNIKEAMNKAGEFEKKHGLSRFSDGESKLIYLNPYYPDFLCELTLPKYFNEGDCSKEYFEKMMNQFFRKGKK